MFKNKKHKYDLLRAEFPAFLWWDASRFAPIRQSLFANILAEYLIVVSIFLNKIKYIFS